MSVKETSGVSVGTDAVGTAGTVAESEGSEEVEMEGE